MKEYLKKLTEAVDGTIVTTGVGYGNIFSLDGSIASLVATIRQISKDDNKVMIVGNGGSAAIASHVAVDLNKNCAVRAMAFNDAAALTCYANDYGYEEVFAQQIERHGCPGDLLIAISSSGSSRNILNAVHAAREISRCSVVTFSGFAPENPMRRLGDVNFYVHSHEYGFVELAHQIFLHAVTDALAEQRKAQKEAAE